MCLYYKVKLFYNIVYENQDRVVDEMGMSGGGGGGLTANWMQKQVCRAERILIRIKGCRVKKL